MDLGFQLLAPPVQRLDLIGTKIEPGASCQFKRIGDERGQLANDQTLDLAGRNAQPGVGF